MHASLTTSPKLAPECIQMDSGFCRQIFTSRSTTFEQSADASSPGGVETISGSFSKDGSMSERTSPFRIAIRPERIDLRQVVNSGAHQSLTSERCGRCSRRDLAAEIEYFRVQQLRQPLQHGAAKISACLCITQKRPLVRFDLFPHGPLAPSWNNESTTLCL